MSKRNRNSRPPSVPKADAKSPSGPKEGRQGHLLLGFAVGVSVCALAVSLVVVLLYAGSTRTAGVSAGSENGRPDPATRCRIVPEYDRSAKKVLVSLAAGDTTLDLHRDVLSRLPAYTEIIMLLPEESLESIKAELANEPYAERVRTVAYRPRKREGVLLYLLAEDSDKLTPVRVESAAVQHGTSWAQALFEVTTGPGGRKLLLASCVHKCFGAVGVGEDMTLAGDNVYLDRLSFAGLDVLRIPLAFKGGNILIDEIGGRRIAITGGDVLRNTRTVWRSFVESDTSDLKIESALRKALDVDEVVVVGAPGPQPTFLYHMDQAVVLLPKGVAAITNIVEAPSGETIGGKDRQEIEQARLFLSELRLALTGLEYRLVNVDTSARSILRYQHYANAIPYIDAETGERTLLMPVFPSSQTSFEAELVKKNTATFESLGYRVVHVPSRAHELKGGIHCLVNVIE